MNVNFDQYFSDVPQESDEWAMTNRGWMYINGECRGYYIYYPEGIDGREKGHYFASVYDRVCSRPMCNCTDEAPCEFRQTTRMRSKEFYDLESTLEWMKEEHV